MEFTGEAGFTQHLHWISSDFCYLLNDKITVVFLFCSKHREGPVEWELGDLPRHPATHDNLSRDRAQSALAHQDSLGVY